MMMINNGYGPNVILKLYFLNKPHDVTNQKKQHFYVQNHGTPKFRIYLISYCRPVLIQLCCFLTHVILFKGICKDMSVYQPYLVGKNSLCLAFGAWLCWRCTISRYRD